VQRRRLPVHGLLLRLGQMPIQWVAASGQGSVHRAIRAVPSTFCGSNVRYSAVRFFSPSPHLLVSPSFPLGTKVSIARR
jgi:hypothetical protein